jgi:hypothetical protein
VTQNSGVLVKGEAKGTNWYGVIKRMISLEFPGQKKLFCSSVTGLMCLLTQVPIEEKDTIKINLGSLTSILLDTSLGMNPIFWQHRQNWCFM